MPNEEAHYYLKASFAFDSNEQTTGHHCFRLPTRPGRKALDCLAADDAFNE